jgi:tyrosyl-tRNA synthetase
LGAARRAATEGGVYVNNARVADADVLVGESLLPGRVAVLRRGKKTLAGVRVSA